MKQPSASTFWRFIFFSLSIFALIALGNLIEVTRQLNIVVLDRVPWLSLFILLGVFLGLVIGSLVISFSRGESRLVGFLESTVPEKGHRKLLGGLLLLIGLAGFAIFTSNSYFVRVMGGAGGVRYLIFVLFSLIGIWGIRILRRETAWMTAFLVMILGQSVIQLFLFYFSQISSYPFAMGWSETSRFYFPSLYLSEKVYGEKFPWPVLHPTLHLLLAPPYLIDTPLWFHRSWQVLLRFLLVGLIVPPLLKRLKIEDRPQRWLVALWMFLFLFTGPVYFHLAVPVIIILWGVSFQDERRTWAAVLLASIWCGWSRVNWYPVPAMLTAGLYFMEQPLAGRRLWNYLLKPVLWFVVGTATAFFSQRIYIVLSGIPESGSFYTSLTSDLLWYRLLPNASYFLGLIPAALLVSIPMWLAIAVVLQGDRMKNWQPVRLFLLGAALISLLLGGLLVSLKIGGGVDLHNLDAYLCLLLIVFCYFVFARYRLENGELSRPVPLHWLLVLAVILMPVWSYARYNIGFVRDNESRTRPVLQSLQTYVDTVNAQGGEILFITQRHLISMHMLDGVKLVPEYEREDLMEMAMANNTEYLSRFRSDMENQRFALIVVDPLNFNVMSRGRSFADENNVWVRRVMKQILCNYRQEAIFAEDDIALYVPQQGEQQCPELK